VIPGKLLVGAYPGVVDDDANMSLLWSLLTQSVTTFCCLQIEYPGPEVTPQMWRDGLAIRPYYDDVIDILRHVDGMREMSVSDRPSAAHASAAHTQATLMHPTVTTSDKIDFVHVPIVDCSVTDDTTMLNLCHDLARRLLDNDEVIYLHCWGGHGRTGTVVCILLHIIYGLDVEECLRYCQFVHDLRQVPIDVGSPQTKTQRDQVVRIVEGIVREKREKQMLEDMVGSNSVNSGVSMDQAWSEERDESNYNANNAHANNSNDRNSDKKTGTVSGYAKASAGKKSLQAMRDKSRAEKENKLIMLKETRDTNSSTNNATNNDHTTHGNGNTANRKESDTMVISGLQIAEKQQSDGAKNGATQGGVSSAKPTLMPASHSACAAAPAPASNNSGELPAMGGKATAPAAAAAKTTIAPIVAPMASGEKEDEERDAMIVTPRPPAEGTKAKVPSPRKN
jgi:hypothetical protein